MIDNTLYVFKHIVSSCNLGSPVEGPLKKKGKTLALSLATIFIIYLKRENWIEKIIHVIFKAHSFREFESTT